MSSAKTAPRRIAPDEYLAAENDGQSRHEYVDGIVYAMAGTSDWHGLVASALFVSVYTRLGAECQVFMTDMKLRVADGYSVAFYYPDVLVSCAADDRERYFREQPVLLIEVLSPHTERVDRGEKSIAYRSIPSLVEYMLVAQDVPTVEVYRRRTGWQCEAYLPGSMFHLASVGLDIAVDDIYRRLPFGAGARQ